MPHFSITKFVLLNLLISFLGLVGIVQAIQVPYLQQSFFFDWDIPGQPFPVPVTQQCESIHIVWKRGVAQGPNNVGPYYLQVYTSLYTVPIIIPVGERLEYDWPVPFPPGTLYQICMFDKNGNTGGCQDTYTVIPSRSLNPSCPNVTLPAQLDVEGTVFNGPISRTGWIDQCSDIQLKPKNGTPPFTVTIAPALHPPYNITSPNFDAVNWTVGLSWASPFFISMVDSAGNMWANGLLHSGGPGTTACLSGGDRVPGSDMVKPAVAVGSGIGGLVLGLLLGLMTMFLFMKKKLKRDHQERLLDLSSSSDQYHPAGGSPTGGVLGNSMGSSNPSVGNHHGALQYHVEPFVLPTEDGRVNAPPAAGGTSPSSLRGNRATSMDTTSSNPRPQNAVYVVHHDSQAPPVTIYHEEGTQIVELPPRYPDGASPRPASGSRTGSSDGRSDGSRTEATAQELPSFLQQNRRPQQSRKPPRDTVYTNTTHS